MLSKFLTLAILPLAILAQTSTSTTTTDTASSTTTTQSTGATTSVTDTTTRTSISKTTTTDTSTATTTAAGGGGGGVPSTCIINCSQAAAAKNGCVTYLNTTCVCGSAQFESDAGTCISAFCPDQLPAALALQNSTCVGITASGTPVTTPFTQTSTGTTSGATNTAPGNGSTTNTGAPTTSTSPSAGNIILASPAGLLTAMGAVILGGLFGSGLVL